MKRYADILLMTLATFLMLTACSVEVLRTAADEQQQPILLSAAMQQSATRGGVFVADVQNYAFKENEVIDVFINENGGSSKTYSQPIFYMGTTARDSETDGKVYYALGNPRNSSNQQLTAADVAWPSTNGIDIRAYHPTKAVTTLSGANTFTVQADQSTDANYRKSDLMAASRDNVARQDERVQLTFRHLLSKVIITLRGDRSLNINHEGWRDGATVEQQTAAQAEANQKLIGATVRLLTISPSITITPPTALGTSATGTAQTITVGTIAATTELVTSDDATSAWQIACIIPPQEIAASTAFVQVTMADGGVLTYKPDAKCTFSSGHANTYNLTVHAKELTLSGNPTIDPWTGGDTDQGHETQPVITM